MKNNRYWFKPKRFGYGAVPVTWEGWTFILLYAALVLFAIEFLMFYNKYLFIFFVLFALIVLIYVSKLKTDGDWKWRWGGKEI